MNSTRCIHTIVKAITLACLFTVAYATTPLFSSSRVKEEEVIRIYTLQGKSSASTYENTRVKTEGVVTLTLFGSDQLGGFFLQDTLGDQDPSTSDAIFVYGRGEVKSGDYIRIDGLVSEYNGRTQLSGFNQIEILAENIPIPYTHFIFPEEYPSNLECIEGMAVAFDQKLYITSTGSLSKYGELILSSRILRSPTDAAYPKTPEYEAWVEWNGKDQLMLDDGSATSYPNPLPFLDKDKTCRTNSRIDSLYGVIDQIAPAMYAIYSITKPNFYGNARPLALDEAALGNYNLKLCGFNIENFLDQSNLQKTRIIKALAAIDADVFGLCELKQSPAVVEALCQGLNQYIGQEKYTYIPWVKTISTYTVVHILYKKDKVEPIKDPIMLNSKPGVSDRRLSQGFTLKENGAKFIFSINHLKAKSGTGTGRNADQGDGQGIYNYQRTQEAQSVVAKLKELTYYYGTFNILCMGDYNAFSKEDPIVVFNNAGYYNQTERFSDTSYSYHYGSHVEYLDYSLANDSMARYITGSLVWHINADEPNFYDYEESDPSENFLYRSSDHDPVIVGLKLTNAEPVKEEDVAKKGSMFKIYPTPCTDYIRWYGQERVTSWDICNMQGKIMLKGEEERRSCGEIDVSTLRGGAYLLRLYTNKGIQVQKMIKNN